MTKLNLEKAREIRKLHTIGVISNANIAHKYSVSVTTIDNIVNNKTWKDDNKEEEINDTCVFLVVLESYDGYIFEGEEDIASSYKEAAKIANKMIEKNSNSDEEAHIFQLIAKCKPVVRSRMIKIGVKENK